MFEPHINTLLLPHSLSRSGLYSSELFIILTICLNEMHFSSWKCIHCLSVCFCFCSFFKTVAALYKFCTECIPLLYLCICLQIGFWPNCVCVSVFVLIFDIILLLPVLSCLFSCVVVCLYHLQNGTINVCIYIVYVYKFKVLENVVFFLSFLFVVQNQTCIWHNFVGSFFFFFLIVMQLCRLIYTYVCICTCRHTIVCYQSTVSASPFAYFRLFWLYSVCLKLNKIQHCYFCLTG